MLQFEELSVNFVRYSLANSKENVRLTCGHVGLHPKYRTIVITTVRFFPIISNIFSAICFQTYKKIRLFYVILISLLKFNQFFISVRFPSMLLRYLCKRKGRLIFMRNLYASITWKMVATFLYFIQS